MLRSLAFLSCIALAACSAERPPPATPSGGVREESVQVAGQSTSDSDMRVTPGAAHKASGFSFSDDKIEAAPASARTEAPAAGAPAPPPPPPPPPAAPAPPTKQETREKQASTDAPHERGMLVYTAKYTMSVYQVEQGLTKVEQIAKDMGGYLSLRSDRDITVRVPRERFEATLLAVDKIGDVLHRDVKAQDVTDEYVDMEIRIKNGHAMQTRLKALLEKAPVKEALEIEKELKRVTEELELLEGKLKLLTAQIAYSTVTVAFEPRSASVTAAKVQLPFPWLAALGLPALMRLTESK